MPVSSTLVLCSAVHGARALESTFHQTEAVEFAHQCLVLSVIWDCWFMMQFDVLFSDEYDYKVEGLVPPKHS